MRQPWAARTTAQDGAEAALRRDAGAFFTAAFAACKGRSGLARAPVVVAAPTALVQACLPLAHALPPEDLTRIARHAGAADRAARRAAWGLARLLLAQVLDCPPAAVAVRRDASGRPHLATAGACDFNLSHGADWVVVGLARSGRIGVDVEELHPHGLWQDIAPLFLDARAAAAWRAGPQGDQAAAALSAWCLKEAVLKATGEGLSGDPRSVPVVMPPGGSESPSRLRRAGMTMRTGTILTAEARCIAFAVEGETVPQLFIWARDSIPLRSDVLTI